MKLSSLLAGFALTLQGASGNPFAQGYDDFLESRAAQKMPTYQQVLAAALRTYPSMKAGDSSGRLTYKLSSCADKCESKKQVKDKDGNCEDCLRGQVANKDQTKCVTDPARRGKCEEGKVLDPSVGGQTASTDNPKCIPDDDQKCPDGRRAASRERSGTTTKDSGSSFEPECAVDEDPDFQCLDSNTYDYKTIENDKIKHGCRSTQKYDENKRDAYHERVKDSLDRTYNNKVGEDRDRQRRNKARASWCFVTVASMGLLDYMGDEINAMSDEEIDGIYAQYPSDAPDPSGDGSIPDYVVEKAIVIGPIESEDAGLGSIFRAIPKIISGGGSSSGAWQSVRSIKAGTPKGPSGSAARAGAKSSTVSRILKDENMLDCVFSAASLAADTASSKNKKKKRGEEDSFKLHNGNMQIVVDWSRKEEESVPAPEGVYIKMNYDDKEDRLWQIAVTETTGYWTPNRLPYETCYRPGIIDGIVSLSVEGGCCAFYDGANCEPEGWFFNMENRQHQDLPSPHRGTIASAWCTAMSDCEGRP